MQPAEKKWELTEEVPCKELEGDHALFGLVKEVHSVNHLIGFDLQSKVHD